jgi:dTDP-4-dehydrorhamnose reductase
VKVLLVGAAGMLGRDIVRACPPRAHCEALDRGQLDVRDLSAVARAISERRPDWLFNCSGITNVEDAERDPELAFAVNATAVGAMARACADAGTRMLHFSTDYVFDGSTQGFYVEDDETGPVNEYGNSKLAGEVELTKSGAEHLLVRTQWLYGVHGRSFAGLMCDRAQARERTRVVSDEYGCCTYTRDLASVTWDLIAVARGTVHVANRGRVSRFDIARRIFEAFGVPDLLTECSSAEFGSIARRPANSALSVVRAERLLGRRMRSWEVALTDFLREREENHKFRGAGAAENA